MTSIMRGSVPLLIMLALFSRAAGQTPITFSFTGGMQTYTVPSGVTFLHVTARGAQGGSGLGTSPGAGGQGGVVTGTLAVAPGQILNIFVGSAGTPYSGGFNGGGSPGLFGGGGGGGASDIRVGGIATSSRVVVAGGGGGGGSNTTFNFTGGKGGDTVGEAGLPATTLGGGPGSQSAPGMGGNTGVCPGNDTVGNMGNFAAGANGTGFGGGGGGGFYGGGSGGSNIGATCDTGAGGGGGGSSNYSTSVFSNGIMHLGGNFGNGSITIVVPGTPSATTDTANHIAVDSADVYGSAADNGATTTVSIDYSTNPVLASGIVNVPCNPQTIATGQGATAVSATLKGLSSNTTYYYRVRATNSVGTTTGPIKSFSTPNNKPKFLSGNTQDLILCQNAGIYAITSLLHVTDPDLAQILTWSVAKMPSKGGVLSGFASANTANSGGLNTMPGGPVSYTPPAGFNGTETFSIQISDNKLSDTVKFTVTINQLPAPIIAVNNKVNLSTGVFTTYQWNKNNLVIIGATFQNYTMTEAGDFTVTVANDDGCSATSNVYKYPPLNIDELRTFSDVILYPNPAKDILHIVSRDDVRVHITGMDGRVFVQSNSKVVDIGILPVGIYSVRIFDHKGGLLKVEKLVKQAH
jgi:hypothetical protein